MGRVEGKVAIVTGAAAGMGAAEAILLAEEGAHVLLADICEVPMEELTRQLVAAGFEASCVRLDVRSPGQWDSAVGQAIARYGRIDILVNNAGIAGGPTEWKDASFEDFTNILSVNLHSQYLGIQAVRPHMERAGGGSIINISSVAGFIAFPKTQPGYTASKGGSRLLTKSAAVDFATKGIRVNSIHPGLVDPSAGDYVRVGKDEVVAEYADVMAGALAKIPMGRMAHPVEIARAVLFLASDEASYITGTELIVDGGMTAI